MGTTTVLGAWVLAVASAVVGTALLLLEQRGHHDRVGNGRRAGAERARTGGSGGEARARSAPSMTGHGPAPQQPFATVLAITCT